MKSIVPHETEYRKSAISVQETLCEQNAQALTEYTVILMVMFGLGVGIAAVFVSFEELDIIFRNYYASLANYINLPFF